MDFHQYSLNNSNILGDLTSPTRDLLDLSKPPVNLGDGVLVSKDGSTAFVSSKKNKLNQFIGDVFVYTFNTSTYSWDYTESLYSISNTDLTNHEDTSGTQVSLFGSSGMCCSSDGSLLAVGASNFRETNTSKGAVFIYERTPNGWVYKQVLKLATNGFYKLGYSMCCDDNMDKLFVGTDATSTLATVYLFENNPSTTYFTMNTSFDIKGLTNLASGTVATFGTSLDCDATGDYLVVGSNNYQQGTVYPGEVQIFINNNGTWSLSQSLYSDVMSNKPTSLTISNGAKLGNKVSVSSDKTKLTIGTVLGYLFFYKLNTSTGNYEFIRTYNSSVSNSDFGKEFLLSKDGNFLMIGQTDDNVFVYKYDSTNSSNPWTEDTSTDFMTLATSSNSSYNNHYNDGFGTKIAMSQDATRVLLGIPGYKHNSSEISGQAIFLFGKIEPTLNVGNISMSYLSKINISPTTTADVSPTLSIPDPSQTVYTLNGKEITITGIGTSQLQVNISGSSAYQDKSATISITGTKRNQTITYFAEIETTGSVDVGNATGITFSSNSGLPVTVTHDNQYMSFNTTTNLFTTLQAGTTNVVLSQAGDQYYNQATPVTISYTINGSSQSIGSIYTIVSNDSVKFYKNGVPYAQMMPTIVDGESSMGFIDNEGNDIDVANLEEQSPSVTLSETDSRIKENGVYSLYLTDSNNYDIESVAGNGLQTINLMDYSKGFTGYINVKLHATQTLTFMGKSNPSNIHWISSGSSTYDAGDYTFRYFAFTDGTVLLWNLESLSVEGTGYTPRDDTVRTFSYTGLLQQLVLPENVNTCTVFLWGAGGSSGIGGYTESTITLPTTGQTLYIVVGKKGENGLGGGGSYVYYMDSDGNYREILVAGGGGAESGGGLVSSGDAPATQLTGIKEPGLSSGLGASGDSGSGYYNGTGGSGGSSFVGSNVIIESFGVTKTSHGSSRDSREDVAPRLDHNSGVMYKDTCCFTPDKVFSDYYHNEQGGDAGKIQQDGFVYIAYKVTSAMGLDAVNFSDNTITPVFNPAATTSRWRYFVFDESILVSSGISTTATAELSNVFPGNYSIFAHALDEENNVLGNLRNIQSPPVTKVALNNAESMFKRIRLTNVGGIKNIRSVQNSSHFLVSVSKENKSFYVITGSLPLSIYITYNAELSLHSVVTGNDENYITEVFVSNITYTGGEN